jgi:D-glycero-D-manno-heptose 1,7-bisphosphate phosphatase
MNRCALFLDRDGVINVDRGYVCTPARFEIVPGIIELCRTASDLGYLNIVVTNQAGIGRGYYSEADFLAFTQWMCATLLEQDVHIAKVYHSPFHPEFGQGAYKRDSDCRKPAPGMILQAAQDFGLDLQRSVLLGDKESDMRAGLAAGVGCNVLYSPDSAAGKLSNSPLGWQIVGNVADVSQLLIQQHH